MGISWKRMTALRRAQWLGIIQKVVRRGKRASAIAAVPNVGDVYRAKRSSIGQTIKAGFRELVTRPESRLFALMLGGIGVGLAMAPLKAGVIGLSSGYLAAGSSNLTARISPRVRRALGMFSGGIAVGGLLRLKGGWKRHKAKVLIGTLNPTIEAGLNSRDVVGAVSPVARVLIDSFGNYLPNWLGVGF